MRENKKRGEEVKKKMFGEECPGRGERTGGVRRGRELKALFELCKIDAWERGGACLNIRVTRIKLREEQSKEMDVVMRRSQIETYLYEDRN